MTDYTSEELDDADRRLVEMKSSGAQLQAAVRQAEGYRNFLSSLTGLLTAVFVLKGQEDLSKLPEGPRIAVIVLLSAGFVALVAASWLGVVAANGRPGERIPTDAFCLLDYEAERIPRIWAQVEWARWLALVGVLAVAAAVIVTWVAPAK
ncbi:hypothetical protein ACFZBP_28375 [Streptomyces sp. NPDC008086]|uniref:hypothetical protein n=1 Tax=Streptomyces sp. NPDC008086 TaxID=3364807 RepID=UPI0036E57AD3